MLTVGSVILFYSQLFQQIDVFAYLQFAFNYHLHWPSQPNLKYEGKTFSKAILNWVHKKITVHATSTKVDSIFLLYLTAPLKIT